MLLLLLAGARAQSGEEYEYVEPAEVVPAEVVPAVTEDYEGSTTGSGSGSGDYPTGTTGTESTRRSTRARTTTAFTLPPLVTLPILPLPNPEPQLPFLLPDFSPCPEVPGSFCSVHRQCTSPPSPRF